MNPSKKGEKLLKLHPKPNHDLEDELKLEIWENEGGAIAQQDVINENKKE